MADLVEFTAFPVGANANGDPIFRVVSDGLQVQYVTVPYKQSSVSQVDATIEHALLALRRPPKPIGAIPHG